MRKKTIQIRNMQIVQVQLNTFFESKIKRFNGYTENDEKTIKNLKDELSELKSDYDQLKMQQEGKTIKDLKDKLSELKSENKELKSQQECSLMQCNVVQCSAMQCAMQCYSNCKILQKLCKVYMYTALPQLTHNSCIQLDTCTNLHASIFDVDLF